MIKGFDARMWQDELMTILMGHHGDELIQPRVGNWEEALEMTMVKEEIKKRLENMNRVPAEKLADVWIGCVMCVSGGFSYTEMKSSHCELSSQQLMRETTNPYCTSGYGCNRHDPRLLRVA